MIENYNYPVLTPEQFKFFRVQAGMTQESVMEVFAAVSISTIWRWENDKNNAIILRVDSPGGSVLTSDIIWKEVMETKKVKPVYASMSDVAASGGYYISMACDTIIAHPLTITGSIGVIMAIPNLSGLMNKLDISLDTISTGPAAQDLNLYYPFSNRQISKMHDLGQNIYFRFVNKVAESRHKTFDETRALAKGRVWTGADAKKMGLIDVLGDFRDAIELVKKRIGVAENMRPLIRVYPAKKDPFDAIMSIFNKNHSGDKSEANTLIDAYINNQGSGMKEIYQALPQDMKNNFDYMKTLFGISQKEQVIMAMPYLFNIN